MMKIAFYKKNELNEVLNEVMNKSSQSKVTCEVSFSDEMGGEVVLISENGVVQNTVELWDVLSDLSTHLNIEITKYDVIEVGDFGEGFAFFF